MNSCKSIYVFIQSVSASPTLAPALTRSFRHRSRGGRPGFVGVAPRISLRRGLRAGRHSAQLRAFETRFVVAEGPFQTPVCQALPAGHGAHALPTAVGHQCCHLLHRVYLQDVRFHHRQLPVNHHRRRGEPPLHLPRQRADRPPGKKVPPLCVERVDCAVARGTRNFLLCQGAYCSLRSAFLVPVWRGTCLQAYCLFSSALHSSIFFRFLGFVCSCTVLPERGSIFITNIQCSI